MSKVLNVRFVRLGIALLMILVMIIPTHPSQGNQAVFDDGLTIPQEIISIPVSASYELNESDLKTFLDDAIPDYMDDMNIAGVIMSVVKDGDVLHSAGYGYADVNENTPASSNTLFGIASISKTFTATAVMTLVENGSLDLDEDVNNYLESFQIPLLENSDPITLRHLLTHTAGFEESTANVFYSTLSGMPSMQTFLSLNLPAQVHPVGYIQSYSNLGAALAGYIVQEVSGIPYEQYIEEYVLDPLGMNTTSAYQDLPSPLDELHSQGYASTETSFIRLPFFYCVVPPTGGISSTADDMASFMNMHLNEGLYNGNPFLTTNSCLEMQDEQFIFHEDLPGIGLGLYRQMVNNETMVYHTGGMPAYSNIMGLFPDHDLGIFISLNTETGDYYDILQMIMDRYYPAPAITEEPIPTTSEDLSELEGFYLPTRRAYVGLSESLISLYNNMITQVTALSDGTLLVTSDYLPGHDDIYERIDDNLFRGTSVDFSLGFRTDADGTFFSTSDGPVTALEKLESWYLEVSGPEIVQFQEGDSSHNIYWTVDAAWWQPDVYTIYSNGSEVHTDIWTTLRGITYDMSRYSEGTYNLTIVVEDILGSTFHDTIMVEISPDPLILPIYGLSVTSVLFLILSIALVARTRK